MKKIKFNYDEYEAIHEKFDEFKLEDGKWVHVPKSYRSGDWVPDMEEVKKHTGPTKMDIVFLIWILETSDLDTQNENKEVFDAINKLVDNMIEIED